MKIQDFFEEAHFINLDCRPERRLEFENEMLKYDLKDFIKKFSASVDATNLKQDDYKRHQACGRSHHDLVKYAKEKNLKNILIFEDDAYFYNGGEKKGIDIIESAIDKLKDIEDWDIFYLGGLIVDDEIKMISENLGKVNTVLTTHAWAINNKAYDKLLMYSPESDSAIDGWVGGYSDRFNRYIAYPLAMPQRSTGKSDCDAGGNCVGLMTYLQGYDEKRLKRI
jgi:GR25 family glycosyltransferase involved in LPS biosynthesis